MATSSITKQFTIKNDEELKRFVKIIEEAPPKSRSSVKNNRFQEGKELLKRYSR